MWTRARGAQRRTHRSRRRPRVRPAPRRASDRSFPRPTRSERSPEAPPRLHRACPPRRVRRHQPRPSRTGPETEPAPRAASLSVPANTSAPTRPWDGRDARRARPSLPARSDTAASAASRGYGCHPSRARHPAARCSPRAPARVCRAAHWRAAVRDCASPSPPPDSPPGVGAQRTRTPDAHQGDDAAARRPRTIRPLRAHEPLTPRARSGPRPVLRPRALLCRRSITTPVVPAARVSQPARHRAFPSSASARSDR
jgi:hypothetical protein